MPFAPRAIDLRDFFARLLGCAELCRKPGNGN